MKKINVFHSFQIRLLALILLLFGVLILSLSLLSQRQISRIIDESQSELYHERLDFIINELERADRILRESDMSPEREAEYKQEILELVKERYYSKTPLEHYPFVINPDVTIVLHPTMPVGHNNSKELPWQEKFQRGDYGDVRRLNGAQNLLFCLFLTEDYYAWLLALTISLTLIWLFLNLSPLTSPLI